MKLYAGTDPYNGWEFLLTVWEDGSHEIAARADTSDTWGPPITLACTSAAGHDYGHTYEASDCADGRHDDAGSDNQ